MNQCKSFLLCFCSIIHSISTSDVGLNSVELITKNGYPCETHHITTEDGYILTFHRIPYGKNSVNTVKRPAVLVMHGLTSSSADYVNMGVNRSLGYVLAERGYDVWLGNMRGNFWSRNHTSLDPDLDNEKFYNFSSHEIGYYDLPASIDYILNLKNDVNLKYIGHSQGGTIFYVMASTRPEYNKKITLSLLLAPAGFLAHTSHPIVKALADNVIEVEALCQSLQIYEIPFVSTFRSFFQVFCASPQNIHICETLYYIYGGNHLEQLDRSKLPVILTNIPSNTGIKQVIHFLQQIRNGGFSYYDYGYEKNKQVYGTAIPPAYNLSAITTPIAIYYGNNDLIVNYRDVEEIAQKLPNVVKMELIPSFCHVDFLCAKDVYSFIYDNLLKYMKNFTIN